MFETIQFRTPATFFGMDRINQLGKEAKKLGFKKCILSKSNQQACRALNGIDLVGIDSVKGLMEMLF